MRDDSRDSTVDNLGGSNYHSGIPGLEGKEASAAIKTDRLMTVQEVCELLNVRKTYVYWLTHRKKIPYIKLQGHLRFRKAAIDEWIRIQEIRYANTEEEIQDRN
ncbi:helix-turn-helix domain-containing protein [Candidatus Poribacteria bacterium]